MEKLSLRKYGKNAFQINSSFQLDKSQVFMDDIFGPTYSGPVVSKLESKELKREKVLKENYSDNRKKEDSIINVSKKPAKSINDIWRTMNAEDLKLLKKITKISKTELSRCFGRSIYI
jgi:hypothetical protein